MHASASTGGKEFTLSQRHRPPFHWESISPLANIWKILGQRSFINSFNISWNLLCPRSFSSPGQIGGTSSDAYIPGLHPEATKSSFVLVPLKTRFPAGGGRVGASGQSTDGPKEAGASNFSLDLLPGCLVPLVGDILIRNWNFISTHHILEAMFTPQLAQCVCVCVFMEYIRISKMHLQDLWNQFKCDDFFKPLLVDGFGYVAGGGRTR